MRACVDVGGSISGEHGIGLEKRDFMPWIFSEADLATMAAVKGVFNPTGRCNPGKIFPNEHESERTTEQQLAEWGFVVTGRSVRENRHKPGLEYRVLWIDR